MLGLLAASYKGYANNLRQKRGWIQLETLQDNIKRNGKKRRKAKRKLHHKNVQEHWCLVLPRRGRVEVRSKAFTTDVQLEPSAHITKIRSRQPMLATQMWHPELFSVPHRLYWNIVYDVIKKIDNTLCRIEENPWRTLLGNKSADILNCCNFTVWDCSCEMPNHDCENNPGCPSLCIDRATTPRASDLWWK